MPHRQASRRVILAVLFTSLLLATACGSDYPRSEKPAGDWSRGLLLGESNIKQSVALQVDAGQRAHLAWIEADSGDIQGLRYAQIGPDGQVRVDQALPLDLPLPRGPQLLVDGRDRLHLALISRSENTQALYHVLIDDAGEISQPTRLSQKGTDIESFQMFFAPDGEMYVIWAGEPDDGPAGIYAAALHGAEPGAPSLLVPDGFDPFVLVGRDPTGSGATAHMVWTQRTGFSSRDVYYATLEDGQLAPPAGQRITSFEYAESATYQPPVIGLDSEQVYLIWSVQNLGGGLTPTAADTYYVSFEPGSPEHIDPRNLKLPTEHRPDYTPHVSPYQINELSPLSPDIYSTDYINAPAVVQTSESELPLVVSLMIESASKEFMQLAVTLISDGDPVGYQLANETSNASVLPTLTADQSLNLHLAWLDTAGFRRYKVYYATTAPEARAWLDRTTVADVGERAATLTWGVLSAIGFLPLTLMWNAPALICLVVSYLLFQQEHLDELGAKVALGLSLVVYLMVKALFLPGLLSAGTPFVYVVPQQLVSALSTIIPVAILLVALAGLIVYVTRPDDGLPPSLFKAYLIFALMDSALSAILYAPRFFDPRG